MSHLTPPIAAVRPAVAQVVAETVANEPLVADGHILTLSVTSGFPPALPGQFVHLDVGGGDDPFLRRPFSVLSQVPVAGAVHLQIMYAVVGLGTARMARLVPGDPVGVLGPLGNGFAIAGYRTLIPVAGGRGVVPLYRLLQVLRQSGWTGRAPDPDLCFLFGARSADHLWWRERLSGIRHRLATEDGSLGHRGTVVQLLEAVLGEAPEAPVVLACGPEGLLERVAEVAEAAGVPSQVSVENIMGCAAGLCRGCVIPRRQAAGSPWPRDGNERYATVCKEGPVFLGAEVDWQAMPGHAAVRSPDHGH